MVGDVSPEVAACIGLTEGLTLGHVGHVVMESYMIIIIVVDIVLKA